MKSLRRPLLLAAAFAAAWGCAPAPAPSPGTQNRIVIKGSDTMLLLVERWA